MKSKTYNKTYFEAISDGAIQSAKQVIPVILQYISPKSVVDIGCGLGAWLSVWKQNGVEDIMGIDGHYINKEYLLIKTKEFIACDLENSFILNRKFDLVTCLEVAEHIKPEKSEKLINSICQAGDIVLFSAAIPYQEGVLHMNEQYPEYWINLFKQNGFSPYDCIREIIWNNPDISWWYRQNLVFFIRNESKNRYIEIIKKEKPVLPLVHPDLLNYKQNRLNVYENSLKNPLTAFIFFSKKYLKSFITLFKK